jgi:hypothetical protein
MARVRVALDKISSRLDQSQATGMLAAFNSEFRRRLQMLSTER